LGARSGGTPAPHFLCGQRRLHRVILIFRCDLDHCETVEVQPAFVVSRSVLRTRSDQALAHTLVYLRSSKPMIGDDSLNDRLPLYHQINQERRIIVALRGVLK
jgi:hypothetical protein